ncbi:MAG: hypothetical protein NVSMB9_10130 [Isosphaeraceae bacterium]
MTNAADIMTKAVSAPLIATADEAESGPSANTQQGQAESPAKPQRAPDNHRFLQ